jgi:hypothetical protein
MKTHTFEVSVTFSERIKDGEIREVTKNVHDSIYDSVMKGFGLSPEESEAITKSIKVRETLSGIEVESTIF